MDKISAKLKVEPPKTLVRYRVLNIKADKQNKGRLKMPATIRVPNIDTIYDPGDKSVKTIKYIVGQRAVDDGKGNTKLVDRLGDIFIERNNNGCITINPKVKRDIQLYQYLEITNYNRSNPNRDPNVTPLFERLDMVKKAKDDFEQSLAANEAVSQALNMPFEDLKIMAEQMQVPTNRDPYEVRMAMKVKAEQHPALFLSNTVVDAGVKIESQIQEAKEKEIITYDEEERRWIWGFNKALILAVKIGEDPKEALIQYYTGTDKGKAAFGKVLEKLP